MKRPTTKQASKEVVQTVADYLFENTVVTPPEISKAINDHFWEF